MQKNKDQIEIIPWDKADELMEFLKPYNPTLHLGIEPDYEWLNNEYAKCISVKDSSGMDMEIAMDGDWTLYFRNSHAHFAGYLSGWEALLEILDKILSNKIAGVFYSSDDNWLLSGFVDAENTTLEVLRKEFLDDRPKNKKMQLNNVQVEVDFWDASLNKKFMLG
jgi:undecaprenyl pyrophosphate synthase